MAFKISKLATRVSVSVITRVLEKQQLSYGAKFSLFQPAANSQPCAHRGVNIGAHSGKFSTSFVASKFCEWKRVSVSRGVFSRNRSVAVLLRAVGVSAAALSSGAICAMAARPTINLDSDKSDWKEAKSEFLYCGLVSWQELRHPLLLIINETLLKCYIRGWQTGLMWCHTTFTTNTTYCFWADLKPNNVIKQKCLFKLKFTIQLGFTGYQLPQHSPNWSN